MFCFFSSGFFGILLSLFPWASCFWMRAFLVLSAGPCQPGCSAQPSPVSTTATSAKTLIQSLRMCLISPSYRSLIWAKKDLHLYLKQLPFAYFQSSQNPILGTKASDKLKEIARFSQCKLLRVYVAFSGFLSQGNKQFSSKKTGTTALFACRDLSLRYKSAAVVSKFCFCQ